MLKNDQNYSGDFL